MYVIFTYPGNFSNVMKPISPWLKNYVVFCICNLLFLVYCQKRVHFIPRRWRSYPSLSKDIAGDASVKALVSRVHLLYNVNVRISGGGGSLKGSVKIHRCQKSCKNPWPKLKILNGFIVLPSCMSSMTPKPHRTFLRGTKGVQRLTG